MAPHNEADIPRGQVHNLTIGLGADPTGNATIKFSTEPMAFTYFPLTVPYESRYLCPKIEEQREPPKTLLCEGNNENVSYPTRSTRNIAPNELRERPAKRGRQHDIDEDNLVGIKRFRSEKNIIKLPARSPPPFPPSLTRAERVSPSCDWLAFAERDLQLERPVTPTSFTSDHILSCPGCHHGGKWYTHNLDPLPGSPEPLRIVRPLPDGITTFTIEIPEYEDSSSDESDIVWTNKNMANSSGARTASDSATLLQTDSSSVTLEQLSSEATLPDPNSAEVGEPLDLRPTDAEVRLVSGVIDEEDYPELFNDSIYDVRANGKPYDLI